jgi:branched-chain amino acid transport system substrate-binding protein
VKRILFVTLAVVFALSMVLVGCTGEGPVAPTKVVLGATLPLTGIFAGFGEQSYGMQKAVDDWNAEFGGMYLSEWDVTVPVQLVIKDNQSDPNQVGSQSTDLVVTNKVCALLSPNAPTDLHDPTTVVATENHVPSIIGGGPFEPWYHGSQGNTAPPYTWFSGFAIGEPQPAPRDVAGYTMVDTWFMYMDAVDALSNTNGIAGVFASSDSDGTGWYQAFPGLMEGYGLTVVGYNETIPVGLFPLSTTDYSGMVSYWIAHNVTILWGNCPGAHFGDLIGECYAQHFEPKICLAARAALFPTDVESWGTTPPLGKGIGCEVWWSPSYQVSDGFVGIGNRTSQSLADDFTSQAGNPPLNRAIGTGYAETQIMLNAIHEAGSLDGDAINTALAATDMQTLTGWVNFDATTHFSAQPLAFGQWFYDAGNVDEPFYQYLTASALSEIPVEESPVFPLPDWYS